MIIKDYILERFVFYLQLNLCIMKLEKISLRNMSDILTDNEMKATRGGYGGGYDIIMGHTQWCYFYNNGNVVAMAYFPGEHSASAVTNQCAKNNCDHVACYKA